VNGKKKTRPDFAKIAFKKGGKSVSPLSGRKKSWEDKFALECGKSASDIDRKSVV
jgi:hypothetical protein